jgi:hypothetical protein
MYAAFRFRLRQIAAWRVSLPMTSFCAAMTTGSRIPQILHRERAIARSLPPFGLALAAFAIGLAMLVVGA